MTTKNKFLILGSLILGLITTVSVGAQSYVPPETGSDYCAYLPINSYMWMGNPNNNRSDVFKLQNFLKTYFSASFFPTGYFGSLTKSYVARIQTEFNITPATGVFGPKTLRSVNGLCQDESIENTENSIPPSPPNPPVNVAPANCKSWYDGCNNCARNSIGSPLVCTMRACMQQGTPYCKEYFSSNTPTPVIRNFTGPVKLNLNQKGTWSLNASISDNTPLAYIISWGDEYGVSSSAAGSSPNNFRDLNQNTTFEHTYTRAGNFTITIQVKSQTGQTARATATVNVAYERPQGTDNAPANCKTFIDSCGNRCYRESLGAPLVCSMAPCSLSVVAPAYCSEYFPNPPSGGTICTQDAKMCPNGTYVGRTGPNCEFVCPIDF